jgi:hypothetical protein
MESDVITLQDVFKFEVQQVRSDRTVVGALEPTGIHPIFSDKFRKRGVELPQGLFGKAPRQAAFDPQMRTAADRRRG